MWRPRVRSYDGCMYQPMTYEFRDTDKAVVTLNARGRMCGNLLLFTSSASFVEFSLSMTRAREIFAEMLDLSNQLRRDGEDVLPLAFEIETLDKGRITLDAEGFQELNGALASAMLDVTISSEAERYKPGKP